jgi:hypothetical protein
VARYQNRTTESYKKAQPVPDKFSPDVSGPSGGFVIGGAFDQSAFCAQKKQLLREIVTKSTRTNRLFQYCQMHSIIAMVNELVITNYAAALREHAARRAQKQE